MNTPAHSFIRRQRGLTLIELAAVLAVLSVMVGASVPSMTSIIRSMRLTSASNDLLGGFLMARSEAIKRNARVVICKSGDGVSCAATGGWEQGWLVFHDADNNGMRESGETILQYQQALSASLRVTGNLNVVRYVSYAPNGATKLVGGGFQAGTITLCNTSASPTSARQIIINANGRARVQRTQVDVCV